eukprot:jgi/Ulvmu1/3467/UM016_0087.1
MAVALLQHAIDNQHPEVQSISPADLPAIGLRIRVEVPKKPSAANGGASNGHKHDLTVKPPKNAPAPRPKNAGQKDSKPPGAGRLPANGGGPGKGSGTPQSDRKGPRRAIGEACIQIEDEVIVVTVKRPKASGSIMSQEQKKGEANRRIDTMIALMKTARDSTPGSPDDAWLPIVKEAMRIAAPDELSEAEVALRWQENCDHEGPDNAPTGAPAATIGAQSAPTGVGIAGNTEAAP